MIFILMRTSELLLQSFPALIANQKSFPLKTVTFHQFFHWYDKSFMIMNTTIKTYVMALSIGHVTILPLYSYIGIVNGYSLPDSSHLNIRIVQFESKVTLESHIYGTASFDSKMIVKMMIMKKIVIMHLSSITPGDAEVMRRCLLAYIYCLYLSIVHRYGVPSLVAIFLF